jgi:tetratricopeptide (TPR) repeat protein
MNRRICGAWAIAVCLLVLGLGASAQISAGAFDAANKLYDQGKFAEAAAAYENLLGSQQASVPLYFNLGNAYFKAGQVGRAVAAYRQAERLAPRDPDVRANLQFARKQVQGPTLSPAAWERWLRRLNVNEWTCLAAIPAWLLFLLLAMLQWRPAWKRSFRSLTILLAGAVVAMGACLAAALVQERTLRLAIVTAPEAVVRQGTLDVSPTVFTAHDGAELQVLDQKDDWAEVSSDPRRIGWVRRDQVLILTPAGTPGK